MCVSELDTYRYCSPKKAFMKQDNSHLQHFLTEDRFEILQGVMEQLWRAVS